MHNGDEGCLNSKTNNKSSKFFVDLSRGDNYYSNDVSSLSSQVDNGNYVKI
jgi:hypothetical protein